MKKSHLVAGVIALLAVVLIVLLWRQGDLSDEVAALRARLEALSQTPPRPVIADSTPPADPGPSDAPDHSADVPTSAEQRIAELERVANGQADIIQMLWDKLNGMELSARRASAPAWSALQAVGAPDSSVGDQRTAWAPATADGGQEWLQVDFDKPVEAATIIVRENCAPGAIIRISAVTDGGNEIPLWQGDAPKVLPVSNTPFAAAGNILTNRVKIYLDTAKVPGWNEIDAVQLIGRDGSRQWATGASASSSYGAGAGGGGGLELGNRSDIELGDSIHSFNSFTGKGQPVPNTWNLQFQGREDGGTSAASSGSAKLLLLSEQALGGDSPATNTTASSAAK